MRRILSVVAVLFLPLLPLSAQYALDVEPVVGFSGVFRAGTWTPVHITVQNLGQDVRGTLDVEVERGDRFGSNRNTVRYRRDVELVSGANKALSFVVPLSSTVYPMTIRVLDGDRVAHEEEYDLLGKSVQAHLTLVLARRPNLDFLLPLYNTTSQRALDVVYQLPHYLPQTWHGYEAVDTMVLHDARLQDLSESQVVAIREWVATGGRLVISGGAHFGPADAQTLAPLADFTTAGITTTTVENAGLLEMGLPVNAGERDRAVVATAFTEYGFKVSRIPIGRGDVVLLPVDYANLVRVAPLTSVGLWNELLAREASTDAIATETRRRVFETDILANQLTLPLYDFPSRLLVFGLAVSFSIGIAAVLYRLSRGRDRFRQWLGLPALLGIVITVAVTGHLALTVTLQPAEAFALSVERAELVEEGGYALVTRDTALFSRQHADYRISHPGTPLLIPMEGRDHLVEDDPGRSTQQLTVGRWSHGNSMAFQVVQFPVSAQLHSGTGYVDVEVNNGSQQQISHLVLLRNGFPQPMGDLPPGEVIEHVATDTPTGDFRAIDWNRFVPDDDLLENRGRLLGDIARRQRFEADTVRNVLVVGWTEEPLLPTSVRPTFAQTVKLHVMTIPLSAQEDEP